MQLVDYLRKNKIKQKSFAQLIGVSESYVCLIIQGKRLPSVPVALQIEQAAKGQVKAIELLGLNTCNK